MIVVAGSINMDLVGRVPRIPGPGETLLGSTFSVEPGGKGANQAVGAARLGAPVAMVGRVGDDDFGRRLRDGLAADGIDVAGVATDPLAATGVALITVADDAENSIVVLPGANASVSAAAVADVLLDAATVVLLQLEVPLETVVAIAVRARARGVKVVLNPAPAQPLPDELLASVDWLTPNESEATALTGAPDPVDAAAALRARGVGDVVVTLGSQGICHVGGAGVTRMPAVATTAVDTVGAGDAFNAGLAVGLHEGRSPADALSLAMAAAGVQVSRPGAQRAMPRRDELSGR